MNKQIAKKHHFIPQFYIKGFANNNEDVYLYDVEYNKVSNSPKKASQVFYKEHLHTVKKIGKKSLLIESAYSELEGLFANMLSQLKNAPDAALQELIKVPEFTKVLILMLSIQYWRNPNNFSEAQEYSRKLVTLYDQALPTNFEVIPFDREDMKFFQKKHKDLTIKKFIQFLILPLLTFKFNPEQLSGLRIIKLTSGLEFICSDNPVNIDGFDSDFNFLGDVYYPLTYEYAITNIQFTSLLKLDKYILANANKKVFGSSKERLDSLL